MKHHGLRHPPSAFAPKSMCLRMPQGDSWPPTPEDIPDPSHGRVFREKFSSVYVVKGVWSLLTDLLLNRLVIFLCVFLNNNAGKIILKLFLCNNPSFVCIPVSYKLWINFSSFLSLAEKFFLMVALHWIVNIFYLWFGELLAIISGDYYWNLTLRMFKSNLIVY